MMCEAPFIERFGLLPSESLFEEVFCAIVGRIIGRDGITVCMGGQGNNPKPRPKRDGSQKRARDEKHLPQNIIPKNKIRK